MAPNNSPYRATGSTIRGRASTRLIALLCLLLAVVVVLSVALPGFSSAPNVNGLIAAAAPTLMIAVGQTLVMIAAGIDLSVGAVAGFAGVVVALGSQAGLPLAASATLALAVGAGIGLWHNFGIARLRVPPFVMTLSTVALLHGVSGAVGGRVGIAALKPGLSAEVWAAIAVAVLASWGLHRTRAGRSLFAVGSDAEAARLAGVDVPRIRVSAYVLCSILAALAGLFAPATSSAGMGWTIDSIAATLMGGTSLLGGIGTLPGAVLGSLLLSIVSDAATLLTAQPLWHDIIATAIIVAAAAVDRRRRRGYQE